MVTAARSQRTLLALVVLSSAVNLWLAWDFLGFVTGDDVEVLQTAFRGAFGLDYEPWSIRSLWLPETVVRPFLEVGGALGVDSPTARVRMALVPFVLFGAVSLWLVHRLAGRWTGDPGAALLAASLYALHPLVLAYTSTALPRGPAVAAILGATVLLSGARRPALRGLAAGLLVAFAFSCRYSEIVFLAPLLVLARTSADSPRDLAARLGGLIGGLAGGVAIMVGWFDLVTWGAPFASLERFARYTLVERRASAEVVAQPLHWYLLRLPHWLPLSLLPLLALASTRPRGRRREMAVAWLFLAIPLFALSLIHHKDLRYLRSILPFVAILAAAGGVELYRRGWRRTVTVLLLLATLWGARTGARHLDRRSLSAAAAARQLAEQAVPAVALSQAWAWGHLLFLGDEITFRDIPLPPDPVRLERRVAGVETVGLYAEDLERDPRLSEVLTRSGFERGRKIARRGSKPVVLHHRILR